MRKSCSRHTGVTLCGSMIRHPEVKMRGFEIGLPLVDFIGTVHSYSASRNTWHSHSSYELVFLLNGTNVYEFSGKALELSGGSFLIIPPRRRHRGLYNVRSPSTVCGVAFDPQCRNALHLTPFTRSDLNWIAQQLNQGSATTHKMSAELRQVVWSLHQDLRKHAADRTRPLALPKLRLLACTAILEAARPSNETIQNDLNRLMTIVLRHMDEHCTDSLQADDLVRKSGYSRARFFQIFRQSTGMTPNDYLLRLRIAKAGKLLQQTAQPITAIAFKLGFSSSQYFCNVFRKYTNLTPRAFRARQQSG
ncbi:MAG: AraC family transcriptional regulator [Verrucomicrobiia bacterium]